MRKRSPEGSPPRPLLEVEGRAAASHSSEAAAVGEAMAAVAAVAPRAGAAAIAPGSGENPLLSAERDARCCRVRPSFGLSRSLFLSLSLSLGRPAAKA